MLVSPAGQINAQKRKVVFPMITSQRPPQIALWFLTENRYDNFMTNLTNIMANSSKWSDDTFLDSLRTLGDKKADECVAQLIGE